MLPNHETQESLDNKLINLFTDDVIDLALLEKLLIDGANPNIGINKHLDGVEIRYFKSGSGVGHGEDPGTYINVIGSTDVEFYPLHLVRTKEAIHLLLKFGANPNLLAYSGDLVKSILTPIEFAANGNEYLMVHALASFSPCTILTETINNTLKIILNNKDVKYSDEAKMAIDILIQKSGDLRKGCDPLRIAFNNEQEEVITQMMLLRPDLIPSLSHFEGIVKNKEWVSNFVEIYKKNRERYIQINYAAMSWIVINQGHSQIESKLSLLPYDILLNIMSLLCNPSECLPPRFFDFFAEISSEEETMKVAAFRKIYTIMNEGDTSLFKSHEFLEKNESVSPIRLIRRIQDKIYYDPDAMTTRAWHLACQHYNDCSPSNFELIKKLNQWCSSNDIVLKMTPNFISFFDPLQNDRRENINNKIISRLNELSNENEKIIIIPRVKICK